MVERTIETWEKLQEKLYPDLIILGRVTRVESFGVFVDIGEAFDGLIHSLSINDNDRINYEDYPKVGEIVKVVILGFSKHPQIEFRTVALKRISPYSL